MKDRQPTTGMEGRVKITPEDGGAAFYARIEMADHPLEKGTPLNKATLFSDPTAALYPVGTETVDDALAVVPYFAWQEVARFDVAGEYTWTADFDGECGVAVIGGGSSGLLAGHQSSSVPSSSMHAFGGTSGEAVYRAFSARKGVSHSIKVGAGGAAAVDMYTASSNAGEESSFDGVVARGGDISGNTIGAQAPELLRAGGGYYGGYKVLFGSYVSIAGSPWQCINPFTGAAFLGSGGGASLLSDGATIAYAGGKNEFTGLGGGNGAANSRANLAVVAGQAGTEMGAGGGGCAYYYDISVGYEGVGASGAGADGGVIIYRKLVF